MKKLLLSLILVASFIASFAQSGSVAYSGVFTRVNDTTAYQAAAATKHAQGYADIYFNNQATTPHFDTWNGSSYDHIFNFASGSGGGVGDVTYADLKTSRTLTSADDLDQSDQFKIVYTNSASPFNVTVDLLDAGTQVMVWNTGSATVTLVQGSGVTMTSVPLATDEVALIVYEPAATPKVRTSSASADLTGDVTSTGGVTTYNNVVPTTKLTSLTSSRTLTSNGDLDQTDNLNIVYANSGTPFNIQVDLLTAATQIVVINKGSATVTLTQGSGVTLSGTTIPILSGKTATIIYQTAATPDVYISVGPTILFSDLRAANAANTINNGSQAQEWQWNSLVSGNGLQLSSSSTAAASSTNTLFRVTQTGANANTTQTTYSTVNYNGKSGTSSTNVAGYFHAENGTNNYGLLVGAGRVGIGASVPVAKTQITGEGTTTGVNFLTENSSGTDRFEVEDNGEVLFSDQGGTAGQVLISGGSNAPPTWSSDRAGVSRILNSSVTTTGNVGTGEDVIFTYTVPAGQLASDKDQIVATFTGELAGSANNKNIKIKFGSTTLFESTSVADGSGSDWSAEVQIFRTGATTQKAIVRFTSNNTAINTLQRCTYSTPAETLSGTVVLSVTGEATANDEVLFHMGDVSYRPHE